MLKHAVVCSLTLNSFVWIFDAYKSLSPSLFLSFPHYYFRSIMLIFRLKWSVLSENYFLFYAFLSWQINHLFQFLLASASLIGLSISWHKKIWNADKFQQQFQEYSVKHTLAL